MGRRRKNPDDMGDLPGGDFEEEEYDDEDESESDEDATDLENDFFDEDEDAFDDLDYLDKEDED